MPATCLDTIISIKDPCGSNEPETSLSGFDLFDLPGISYTQAASIADDPAISGYALLKDKRRLALLKIKTDLFTFLQGNKYIPNIAFDVWRTGELKTAAILSTGDGTRWRGSVIYARRRDCLLRKIFIPCIYVKSSYDGNATLRIDDGGLFYDYTVALQAGKIIKYTVNFTAESNEVKLLMPDNIPVYKVHPKCSCGDDKSECVTTLGISNNITSKDEGYGIWADIQCSCDYDFLLCNLATQGLMGEIVLYLTGALVMDEATKTDRLNYYTVYSGEEAANTKAEWMNEYISKWNTLIQALPNLLPRVDRCGCIQCGGSQFSYNR